MKKILCLLGNVLVKSQLYCERIKCIYYQSQLGFLGKGARLDLPASIVTPKKIFIFENAHISKNSQFIISRYGESGKFIMKKNSGAAQGLTIVTGNHRRVVGMTFKEAMKDGKYDDNKDIIIEEDVLISSNVTLLTGAHIGRGSTVGSGAVVRNEIPPYAVVVGNPAKIVGFSLAPDEVIEHEKKLYPENERLSLDILENNYRKYLLSRTKEIKNFTKL